MINNLRPPRHGEPVPLKCLKCNKTFVGPNPDGPRILDGLFSKIKRAKCPECGSRKVVRNPYIQY